MCCVYGRPGDRRTRRRNGLQNSSYSSRKASRLRPGSSAAIRPETGIDHRRDSSRAALVLFLSEPGRRSEVDRQ